MLTTLGRVKETFKQVRENALANPWLYDGKYTQRTRKDAYIEYLETIIGNQKIEWSHADSKELEK